MSDSLCMQSSGKLKQDRPAGRGRGLENNLEKDDTWKEQEDAKTGVLVFIHLYYS